MEIDNKTLVKYLAGTRLFSTFRQSEVEAIVPYIVLVKAQNQTVIFDQGEEGDAWYVVLTGKVTIQRELRGEETHPLATLGTGECFGEMALMDGSPRMASAHSDGEAILARLSRDAFEQLLGNDLPLAIRLLRAMSSVICARTRELTDVLQDLVEEPEGPTSESMAAMAKAFAHQVTWN